MNTKEEILSHLQEILRKEGEALRMYMEIVNSVGSPALKSFFMEIANEEKQHAETVRNLISVVEG